jgi:hypothetical protein
MKLLTRLLLMSALAVVFGSIATVDAIAQIPARIPETSFLHVTEPLDVGGNLLQPGTYVIRVLAKDWNQNVLQVTNEDRTKVFATVLTIPRAYTADREGQNTEYVLYPAVEGYPRALKTWYAVDSISKGGHDIIYPEPRAMELAPLVKEPVYAYKGEDKVEELKVAPTVIVVTPTKQVIAYVEPAPKPVFVAEARELPVTASHIPLFATIGLLLVVVAFGIRAMRVA